VSARRGPIKETEQAPPHDQSAWRFRHPLPRDALQTKGTCPAGGAHEAQGFIFVLPTTAAKSVAFD
jgi:hypothetical protein